MQYVLVFFGGGGDELKDNLRILCVISYIQTDRNLFEHVFVSVCLLKLDHDA